MEGADMTLIETIREIESAAIRQPSVNMIVRSDVLRINKTPDRRYGIFAWTQMQHSASLDNDFINYRFSLFYVDRLTEDRSNETEVQSVGIQTLDNIIRTLAERGFQITTWTYQPFTERFVDECAGVWCEVTLSVPVSYVCVDTFGDSFQTESNDNPLIF